MIPLLVSRVRPGLDGSPYVNPLSSTPWGCCLLPEFQFLDPDTSVRARISILMLIDHVDSFMPLHFIDRHPHHFSYLTTLNRILDTSSFLWLLHSVVSLNKFHFFWLYMRAFDSAFPSLSFWTQHTFSISALWYTWHDDEVYKNLTHDSFERRSLTPWNNTMPRACVSCGFVSTFYWCTLSFILVFMVA